MKGQNVIRMDLSPAHAQRILQEVADEPSRVFLSTHAEERMVERSITLKQILCCLRHGKIKEGPYREAKGNWKMVIETISAGDRVCVVGVLDHDDNGNYCVVITVYLG